MSMKKILFLVALLPFLGAGCATNPPENTTLPVPTSTTTVTTTDVKQGTITGALSYPAGGFPPDLEVCALNTASNAIDCNSKLSFKSYKDSTYSLTLPAGAYIVYAERRTDKGFKGYYSEAVTCGGGTNCQSHKNIVVTVTAGSELTNIDPGDWYAPNTVSYFLPQDIDAYLRDAFPINTGGIPALKVVYVTYMTTTNSGESPMRTAVQAAVAAIPAGGGPPHANVVYLKVKGTTAYVMLDIDFDGWAGSGAFTQEIHPIIVKNVLQFTAIKKVVFGPAPGDTVEQIGRSLPQ